MITLMSSSRFFFTLGSSLIMWYTVGEFRQRAQVLLRGQAVGTMEQHLTTLSLGPIGAPGLLLDKTRQDDKSFGPSTKSYETWEGYIGWNAHGLLS